LVLCFIANFAQGLAFNLFLHFPGFLHELGATETVLGLVIGLTGAAAIAVRPPVGRVMDDRGRRPIILLGGSLNIAVCLLYVTVTSIGPWLYTIRIFHGLAEAMLFTSLFTYAADWIPSAQRTQGIALFGISGMLPIALAGLLGDAILARADFDALFLLAFTLAGVALLFSLPLRDHPRVLAPTESSRGFTAALVQRNLLPLWLIGTVFSLAVTTAFVFVKRFVDESGYGSVGSFFAVYSAAAITLRVFFGWLPDRIGPKRVLIPALGSLAAGLVVLGFASGDSGVLAAGLLFGVGHGFSFPILFGIVVTRAGDADRGSAMAIYTALFDLALLVGAPLLGALIDATGFRVMFTTAAVILLSGTVVFVLWDSAYDE